MQKRSSKSTRNFHKPHLKPPAGHVSFRLLCHTSPGAAVIGRGGLASKKIISETGVSLIHVDDTLPGSHERIVYIVGPGKLDKTLILKDGGGGEIKFEVSVTQLGLFRVLEIVERMEGLRCCRLLTVDGEQKMKSLGGVAVAVGACVRVLPLEEHPLCAHISDDLIQITGDSLAVKKTLLAVTYCLQGNYPEGISQLCGSVSYGTSHNSHGQKHQRLDTTDGAGGQSCRIAGTKEVVFRLLCPPSAAAGLDGWGGSITKGLEKETGARVEVSEPVAGCTDRVIRVSAMENKEWQNSPAQDATLRLFIRLSEAASVSGPSSGSRRAEPVLARLLVPSSQANILDINDTAGANVQILESQCSASFVEEKVIQIVGEHSDVQICLLQVMWTLRESLFSGKIKMTPLLPHKLYGRPPHVYAPTTLVDELDSLGISHDTNHSLQSTTLSLELPVGRTLTASTENLGDSMASSSSSKLVSGDECAVIRNTVEVIVPAHVFCHVYGLDGGNLSLMRQISGATIIVHDPCPGIDGKVIISGTPNQTIAAKSMLYAFIISKQDCMIIT